MEHIQFTEDTFVSKNKRQDSQIPQKGIEGWLYKKIPGSPIIKKIILLVFILLLFLVSVGIFIVTKTGQNIEDEQVNFQERIKSTQLR